MNEKYIKLIPTRKVQVKVLNKAKFSRRLGKLLLKPIKQYSIEHNNSKLFIEPTFYCNKKIAINIETNIEYNQLTNWLYKVLFPFDLYIRNINIRKKDFCYLNNIYEENLLQNGIQLQKYDYIININDSEDLNNMDNGFIEAIISLLQNNNIDFINIGKNYYKYNYNILYENDKFTSIHNYFKLNIFDLYHNKDLKISYNFIFNTNILADLNMSFINNIKEWNKEVETILIRLIYLLANRKLHYNNLFIEDKNIALTKKDIFSYTYDELYNKLLSYDTITFDIFDTLVTRRVLKPDDLFLLVEQESKLSFSKPFLLIRKEAEIAAIKKLKKDVTLNEIYNELKIINNFSEKQINMLKALEIELELNYIIPRDDMVKLYNDLLTSNKNIDIISDMYLPKTIIVKILDKCGIKNYRKLLISCELNKRKDKGDMWQYYFNNNNENTIHIGDNYYSDYLQVLKYKKDAINILSGREYLKDYYEVQVNNINDSIVSGTLYNKFLFNSPFFNKYLVSNNFKLYGYLFAPVFITFFNWFSKNNNSDKILFISREGYYLQKIYKVYCQLLNIREVDNIYFLASRRATSLASCTNIDNLIELLDLLYNGTIYHLFINRYGIKLNNEVDDTITLPQDKDKVIKLVKKYADEILKGAKKEKKNYLKYIRHILPDIDEKTISIVDVGYSGTTQYYLSKILNKKIQGYYFTVTNNLRPKKIGCKIIGCFNVNEDGYIDENNIVYLKTLLLEAILSAPFGQLIKFDIEGNPIYTDGEYNKRKSKYLDQVYLGIIEGMHDLYGVVDINRKFIIEHYKFICCFFKNNKDINKILNMDDNFCCDGTDIINLLSNLDISCS